MKSILILLAMAATANAAPMLYYDWNDGRVWMEGVQSNGPVHKMTWVGIQGTQKTNDHLIDLFGTSQIGFGIRPRYIERTELDFEDLTIYGSEVDFLLMYLSDEGMLIYDPHEMLPPVHDAMPDYMELGTFKPHINIPFEKQMSDGRYWYSMLVPFEGYVPVTVLNRPVPEPSTMILIGMGLVGLVATRRRCR